MRTRSAERVPNPLPYILGINFGANVFVVFTVNVLIDRVTQSDADRAFRAAQGAGLVPWLMTYGIPAALATALAVWQGVPLMRASRGQLDGAELAAARRCALRMPLVQAGIACLAWLLGTVGLFASAALNGVPILPGTVLEWSLGVLAHALFTAIVVYYALEQASRRRFIPRLFPEGRLAELSRGAPLPVRLRFFIFYLAVSAFPLYVAYNILRSQLPIDVLVRLRPHLELTLLGLAGLSALLTELVSAAYAGPLVAMKRAVGAIRQGDYEVRVAVTSDDEIGELGDGLNEMAAGLREAERIKTAFGRVVDPVVRDYLLGGHLELGGELREATILFSDIRGFTTLSESLRPPEVVALLNRYFERVSGCIEAERGLVNKYIGDAVMALFGVPVPLDGAAGAAVRAALRMREGVRRLSEELVREGLPAIRAGTGIHHGLVLAGNIGSSTRMEYTVIGDTVNIASRVEGLCKDLGRDLIVTRPVWERLGKDVSSEYLAEHSIRGRSEPVRLYAIP